MAREQQGFNRENFEEGKCSRFWSVTLMVKVDKDIKPESKPAGLFVELFAVRYVHGFAKVD